MSTDGHDGGSRALWPLGELREAISSATLDLVYQPKYDLHTNRIVGVEALVRWPHRERGVLLPADFLSLARSYGLMEPMTDFVLNRALDDVKYWRQVGFDVPVAVNMFAPSLADPELPQRIRRALEARGLGSRDLVIEITEDAVLNPGDGTRQVLDRLRREGIRISIDDFGTGYSALSYLRDLPIDEIKLDRTFIAPIAEDPRAAAVVRSVIDLARTLCLNTVAEGVEDAPTVALLLRFGCDVGQGHYFSAPVARDRLLELLRELLR